MTKRYQLIIHYQCPSYLKEDGLTLEQFAIEAGVHPGLLVKLMELGLINYSGRMDNPRFKREEILKVQKMIRLRRDLGINWIGVGLVLDLLDEIEELRKEIKRLKKW
ncbi:MAG: chaperone modulatory protein CbpM [Clostridia bacterium]|jgi:hypothetical protein|nr:chaperone modulatory protein CbpM [Clostridia bacterium]MDN5321976.1 chaperone modulatory protein CbpM [Clostridia bacterium]